MRDHYRERSIVDDASELAFEPGTLSFSGHAPHSRTSQLYFVMPGASESQLAAFGADPWDAPVGRLAARSLKKAAGLRRTAAEAPWGDGPDPDKLNRWGYDVLRRPPFAGNITYFRSCGVASPAAAGLRRLWGGLKGRLGGEL